MNLLVAQVTMHMKNYCFLYTKYFHTILFNRNMINYENIEQKETRSAIKEAIFVPSQA